MSTAVAPAAPAPVVHIVRRPVYDGQLNVTGYELMAGAGAGDGERAASDVVLGAVTEIGLDRLVGAAPALVEISRRFLLELHALALPPERVVLVLREHAELDPMLVAAAERVVEAGHRLVVDHVDDAARLAPLLRLASGVRIPVAGRPRPDVEADLAAVLPFGLEATATGVEDYVAFAACRNAGFQRFQGGFFCTPDTVGERALPSGRITDLRSVAGLYASSVSFEELEAIIANDVGLSLRLLRYLNSAYFSLPRKVGSVREALTLLGANQVRRWARMLALAGIEDKPHELLVTALVRARMCERLAPEYGADPDVAFTCGLLSVTDALLDMPLGQVLETLPLADEVAAALVSGEGPCGALLRGVLAYERGLLDAALPPGAPVADVYLEALAWAAEAAPGPG